MKIKWEIGLAKSEKSKRTYNQWSNPRCVVDRVTYRIVEIQYPLRKESMTATRNSEMNNRIKVVLQHK
jgi:hypothetical protein